MKINKWTLGLAAVGLVSLTTVARADDKPSEVQTALANTTISGYVSVSANVGLTGSYAASPASDIPFQSPTKENGFNLDVVKLVVAKPEDATPWASGYEVDLLFGPDAVGYNTSVNASKTTGADFAVKQAFVTLNTPIGNGLDWKLGVFDSPLGYEVFDAGSNPNYTRSWGYFLEPTELTGVQASYKVCDALSLNGGVANTSSAFINNRNDDEGLTDSAWHKAYFGDITLTAPSSWGFLAGSTAFAGVLYGGVDTLTTGGHPPYYGYMGGNQINYYGGLTLNSPWKALTGGVALDFAQNYGGGSDFTSAPPTVFTLQSNFNIWSIGLYGTYKATDKLSFSARGEYVEADDYYNSSFSASTSPSQNLVEVTGTVEYDLWANVQTRLEARWDQNLSTSEGLFPVSTTFVSERDSVGLYANIIYKF